ncbi:MAG: Fic family protein [Taibaiella sp.]|nr:Fic family protein [Taibaiella sp.]
MYIHQLKKWPAFYWEAGRTAPILAAVRYRQGRMLGRMEALGFRLRENTALQNLTAEILKSNEIEGEMLNPQQVRSSIARKLGMDVAGLVPADRHVEGVVEMMLNATQQYEEALTADRLFSWHASLFPVGRSGMHKITVGYWRGSEGGLMQVVSGPMGRETVHFEAPQWQRLEQEMQLFLDWYNSDTEADPIIKAAIAHLWFVTIHPFDDGNGRIARAMADMQLARAEESAQRFYSMSAQIEQQKQKYYDILEQTQKGTLDITDWIEWFLRCLDLSLRAAEADLATVMAKTQFWDKHGDTTLNPRQVLMLNKLLDGFTGKLNTSKWAKLAKCSPDTALRDIQDLIEKDILMKEEGGGRSTNYGVKTK